METPAPRAPPGGASSRKCRAIETVGKVAQQPVSKLSRIYRHLLDGSPLDLPFQE